MMQSDRFTTQSGHRIAVQIPEVATDQVLQAILQVDPLIYGDYDRVTFQTRGIQRFRSLPGGRNAPNDGPVEVNCVELAFFTGADTPTLERILRAIYDTHPYEEPVILISAVTRTCHIRGLDEHNPNRFWNGALQDWVPPEHR